MAFDRFERQSKFTDRTTLKLEQPKLNWIGALIKFAVYII